MKKLTAIIAILIFALCLGCSSDKGQDSKSGTARVTINLGSPSSGNLSIQSVPSTVAKIRITVSGSGMTTMTETISVAGQTSITATIYVPTGTERTFLIEALSSTNIVLYTGSKVADISGDQVSLAIALTADITGQISLAISALEARDARTANITFSAAYALEPSNNDACFGLAITDLLLLVENPSVVSAITSLGETSPTAKDIMEGGTCTTEDIGGGCFRETCTMGSFITDEEEWCSPSKPSLSAASVEEKKDNVSLMASLLAKLPSSEPSTLKKAQLALQKTIPAGAMSVTQLQALLENTVLPAINNAIAKLRQVQGKGYTFTVTPPMTNYEEPSNIILDDGEFYALDAALCAVKAAIKTVTAYNLDVDYDIVEADPLSIINGPTGGWAADIGISANFLTLKADGSTKLSAALAYLRQAVDRLELGYNFVKNLDADQATDNGIDFIDWTAEDHSLAQKALDAAQLALTKKVQATYDQPGGGSVTITVEDIPFGGSTTITFDGTTSDTVTRSMTVDVDLTQAFTGLINSTDLPTLGYDLTPDWILSQGYSEPIANYIDPGWDTFQWTDDDNVIHSDIIPTSNLPDWTLNGIFPNGLTTDVPEFVGLIASGPSVLLTNASTYIWDDALTTDGTDLFTYKQDCSGPCTSELLKINPATGDVTTYFAVDNSNTAGGISGVYDLAHDGTNFWASGRYYDGFSYQEGVFIINSVTGKADITIIPAAADTMVWGLTYDWVNSQLFAILHYHTNIVYDGFGNDIDHDCNDALAKFSSGAGLVNTSDIIMDDVYSDGLAFDGTYVWAEGLRINSTSLAISEIYMGAEDASAYMSAYTQLYELDYGKLWVYIDPNPPI
jgi:hypothetical protein